MKVLVIGAGLGGLWYAIELKKRYPLWDIRVVEKRDRPGGRIRSDRNGDAGVFQFDWGAWRVHSSHQRMHRLVRQFGIPLRPMYAPTRSRELAAAPRTAIPVTQSQKGALANRHDLATVDQFERATGYIGSLSGPQKTYTTRGGHFSVPTGGMQDFIDVLIRHCATLQIPVYYSRHVQRLTRHGSVYRVTFATDHWDVDSVVLNVAPHQFPQHNFGPTLQPLQQAVRPVALCHVYVRRHRLVAPLRKVNCVVKSWLGQVITISADWLMISYTGGWLAAHHFQMWTFHKGQYLSLLKKWLPPVFRVQDFDWESLRVCFWAQAIHQWLPTVKRASIQSCVQPHPIKLPHLFCVNEAFSDFQGWGEGTLQAAEIALAARPFPLYRQLPRGHVVFDGRVLDLSRWPTFHPGGRVPILRHDQEDITDLFLRIHSHAPYAFGWLLSFQKGFRQ